MSTLRQGSSTQNKAQFWSIHVFCASERPISYFAAELVWLLLPVPPVTQGLGDVPCETERPLNVVGGGFHFWLILGNHQGGNGVYDQSQN